MCNDTKSGRELVYDGFCCVWKFLITGWQWPRTVVESTDSLNILIYVVDQQRVLLLIEPRPGKIFLEGGDGKIVANIAGRFDGKEGPAALAIKEAKEEAGVTLRDDQVEFLNNGQFMYLSPGLITERAILAYAEVASGQIDPNERSFGAEGEDEQITRVWMTLDKFRTMICDDVRLFALREWFFRNKIRSSALTA